MNALRRFASRRRSLVQGALSCNRVHLEGIVCSDVCVRPQPATLPSHGFLLPHLRSIEILMCAERSASLASRRSRPQN